MCLSIDQISFNLHFVIWLSNVSCSLYLLPQKRDNIVSEGANTKRLTFPGFNFDAYETR